jgi:hypothetical protein
MNFTWKGHVGVNLHDWDSLGLNVGLDVALNLGVVDGGHGGVGLGLELGGELGDSLCGVGSSGVGVLRGAGGCLLNNGDHGDDHGLGGQDGCLATLTNAAGSVVSYITISFVP